MSCQYVRVRVGSYAGNDPYQDVLGPSLRHDCLKPIDVVWAVDHDQANAAVDRHPDLLRGFGVSVEHNQGRIDAGLECGQDLATAGDIEAESRAAP